MYIECVNEKNCGGCTDYDEDNYSCAGWCNWYQEYIIILSTILRKSGCHQYNLREKDNG